MSEFVTVARVGEIAEGQGRSYRVAGRAVAIFLADGTYYALEDRCPHMGASLAVGEIRNGAVICDRHLWSFRLADGVCQEIPRLAAASFPVRIAGDEIQVCV